MQTASGWLNTGKAESLSIEKPQRIEKVKWCVE